MTGFPPPRYEHHRRGPSGLTIARICLALLLLLPAIILILFSLTSGKIHL